MHRLLVLGTPQVRDPAGVPLGRLMQPRPLALLAVLAAAGAHGATRDRLAMLLWGEADENRARHNLSVTLYLIHRELGPDAVTTAGQVLFLSRQVVSSDLDEFLGALRQGDRETALALYRGPFLEGFHVSDAPAFEEWLGLERQSIANRCAEAAEVLALASGDAAGAAHWWRRLVAEDPLNSRLVIALARSLAAAGDRGNAMEALVAHRVLLRHELGMDGARGLDEVMEELRAADRGAARGSVASSGASPGPPAAGEASGAEATPLGAGRPDAPAIAPLTTARRGRRIGWPAALAGVVSVAVVGTLAGLVLAGGPLAIVVSDIAPLTSQPGFEFQPAISPDGREVAFAAGPVGLPYIAVRSTSGAATAGERRFPDPSVLSQLLPSWSADGQLLRFRGCRLFAFHGCEWQEAPKLNGPSRTLPLPTEARWPVWSPDDRRVAYVHSDSVFLLDAADRAVRLVALHPDSMRDLHSLTWSPDGRRLAYVSGNSDWRFNANVAGSSVWVVDAAGGTPAAVTTAEHLNTTPQWLDGRHLLFVSNRDGARGVYVVRVGRRGPAGAPRAVPGIADPYHISFAAAGRKLAFAKLSLSQNIRAYPLSGATPLSIRDGRQVTTGFQVVEGHDLSPDGRWVVYASNLRGSLDLYIAPEDGGGSVRLTEHAGPENVPRWSPDGREIAFLGHAPGASSADLQLLVLPVAGGTPVALTHGPDPAFCPAWSPDGLRIAFCRHPLGRIEVWLVQRDSVRGPWKEPVRLIGVSGTPLDWAPDGSGVLCHSRDRLFVVSPEGRVRWQRDLAATSRLVAVYGGARYSRDGRTIYVAADHADGRRGVWAIPVAPGPARLVVVNDDPGFINMASNSVGRDRLYVTVAQPESDIWVASLRW